MHCSVNTAACAATAALVIGLAAFTPAAVAGNAQPKDTITIDLVGRISHTCDFGSASAQSTVLPTADLLASFSSTVSLPLNCNTPFRIAVASANGALKSSAAPDKSGFAFEKAYKVGLKVDTDGGQMNPADCLSTKLKMGVGGCAFYGEAAGAGLSSNNKTALNKTAQLTVSWTPSSDGEPRLAAGDYQDTIIITVGADT